MPDGEGPAAWIHWGVSESLEEMPLTNRPVSMNRERELGLDRRETG